MGFPNPVNLNKAGNHRAEYRGDFYHAEEKTVVRDEGDSRRQHARERLGQRRWAVTGIGLDGCVSGLWCGESWIEAEALAGRRGLGPSWPAKRICGA